MSSLARTLATGCVLLALGATGLAHEGATGVAKDRMDLMGDMSKRLKDISRRLSANRDLSAIAADAKAIDDIAPRIPSLFPQGSDKGITDAKPAIWEHWNDFLADTNKLREETGKLATLASSGDARALSEQYRSVAKACIACHDSFRRGRADKL
jgi:cytochrome c556